MGRREELLEQAVDYVLTHGLFGLSLRPLADALGTSDRMLLYHFKSKDLLVTEILRVSNERSLARLRDLPASADVRTGVLDLWQAISTQPVLSCVRLYIEASALGLFGSEPYASSQRATNEEWIRALEDHLVEAGLPREAAPRVVVLVDASFQGFVLDFPLEEDPAERRQAIEDLAVAARVVAASS
ncbi:MAG: TetR/AcrR family transcriptional regulator [Nocardioidaceae bacterium]